MKLYWNYTPSPVDQCAAETWVETNDCTVVDLILIGEHSLAASANELDWMNGVRSPTVTVKRRSDLGNDLATALVDLRLRMPPGVGTRSLTNY
jgi:hypothetical protein